MAPEEPTHPVSDPTPPLLSPRSFRRFATALYALFAAGGLLWIRLRTGHWWPESLPGREPLSSLAWGGAMAVVVVVGTGLLLRASGWMQWLAREIRHLIGCPDVRTSAHIAVVSGVGEELLFRGAMQPALGYVETSLLFGLLHTGPDRRFLGWTFFAIVVGFALGGIAESTGSLWGPIFAHVMINFLNLVRIGRMSITSSGSEPLGTSRAEDDLFGPSPDGSTYLRRERESVGGDE